MVSLDNRLQRRWFIKTFFSSFFLAPNRQNDHHVMIAFTTDLNDKLDLEGALKCVFGWYCFSPSKVRSPWDFIFPIKQSKFSSHFFPCRLQGPGWIQEALCGPSSNCLHFWNVKKKSTFFDTVCSLWDWKIFSLFYSVWKQLRVIWGGFFELD